MIIYTKETGICSKIELIGDYGFVDDCTLTIGEILGTSILSLIVLCLLGLLIFTSRLAFKPID